MELDDILKKKVILELPDGIKRVRLETEREDGFIESFQIINFVKLGVAE